MKRKTRKPAPARPEGVRILRPDGSAVPCGVFRDPAEDHDGLTAWTAHPLDESFVFSEGDVLACAVLPGKCALTMNLVSAYPPAANEFNFIFDAHPQQDS